MMMGLMKESLKVGVKAMKQDAYKESKLEMRY